VTLKKAKKDKQLELITICLVHLITLHCLSVQRVGVGGLDLKRLDSFAYGGRGPLFFYQEEK